MSTILVIGCTGTGKSLLLKKLEPWSSSAIDRKNALRHVRPVDLDGSIEENPAAALYESDVDVPVTKPTIGTNVCNASLSKGQPDIALKEIGGSMYPLWKSSYKDASKLIFMVDISNTTQISAATSLIYEVISSKDLETIPILIVLNKIDIYCSMSKFEMKYLIGLEDILEIRENLSILETSIKYETGIADIVRWILAR